ncbi:MAG: GntR family transcriptional regulator [Alphaproteobacteria bacterium]|nr:GntR family transcriptional regulator [Alphaproteobacteria bacterium]
MGDLNIEKVGRSSLAEEAISKLRRLILLGDLVPGSAVRERNMAEFLGISRTPLREAVQQLAVEGLIEYSATRRPFVANPTIDDIRGGMTVMAALEALAGEQACLSVTDAEINQIGALHERMMKTSGSGKPLEFFETDMEFHHAIISATHNTVLKDIHSQVNARLWRVRFLSSRMNTRRDKTLSQHGEIFDSVLARDPKRAAKAMSGHLETGLLNIQELLEEDSER